LEIFIAIIVFIGKCIYTTLPAVFANVAPVLVKKINFLNYPIDFNKSFSGKPILGPNKTFRGLFFGILFSVVIINIQFIIYKFTGTELTLYDFKSINFELLGFLMGFGVIAGDAVKSFFKRQFSIAPGKPFIPWDQIDCVLGGLLAGRIAWDFSIEYGLSVIILTFIFHILIRHLWFYLGLSDSKW
jgi:CDP-2,3-bis-(O-geranylgeranyl)-sn-glycerol synthase